MKKALLTVVVVLLLVPAGVAAAESFARFDLSLAGYHLGMTYDEATAVRPFHYLKDSSDLYGSGQHLSGYVDGLSIDDVSMNIEVTFSDERVTKVLARFQTSQLEEMIARFQSTFGETKNDSRTISMPNGEERHQTIYRWRFPAAEVLLVGVASNADYATACLLDKRPVAAAEVASENR